MEALKKFYSNYLFVVAFLVLVLTVQMTLGKRVTFYFLMLVLLSMLVVNADTFAELVNMTLGGNKKFGTFGFGTISDGYTGGVSAGGASHSTNRGSF